MCVLVMFSPLLNCSVMHYITDMHVMHFNDVLHYNIFFAGLYCRIVKR